MSLLPGLYFTVLAAGLAFALKRWWDPVPLRAWAVYAAVLLILFGPALFAGRVLLPADILPGVQGQDPGERLGNPLQSDLVTQIAPALSQVRRALRAGEWPLWTPLVGAGMPLLADPQSQTLQPLALLALPLSLPQAVGVTAALRVLVALVFFYLFLRRQGLGEGAALVGSLAYGLSGFLLLWLGWPLANSAALLPLVLYALVITYARGERRDFALLGLAAAAVLLAGHPETILYVITVAALFAGARLLTRPPQTPGRGRLVARWAATGLLAFGLAAPALVPTASYLPQSHRGAIVERRNERLAKAGSLAGLRTPDERRETAGLLGKRLTAVVAPNALGNSRFGSYWGEANTNEDAGAFVGGATLLAALLAFAPARRRLPQEKLFLALGSLSLLVALRPPGLPTLLAALPVLDQSVSSHRRLLMVAAFCLAYAAACTVERWLKGEGPGRRTVAVCGLVLLAGILSAYLGSPPPQGVDPLTTLRSFSLILQLTTLTLTTLLLIKQLPPLPGREGGRPGEEGRGGEGPRGEAPRSATSEGPHLSSPLRPPSRTGGETPAGHLAWTPSLAILVVLVAVELLALHRPANPSLPRERFYPVTPAFAFLQENAEGWRIVGLGNRLLPNAASVYGLTDARISNPLKPFRYAQTVSPVSVSVRAVEDVFIRPDHPIYQLLGVRYILAPKGFPRAKSLKAVYRDPTARIFERPDALPRLFLPAAAEVPQGKPWTAWVAANPDFAARALVQPSPGRPAAWSAADGSGSLDILFVKASHLGATTRLAEERLVASSVYQDGGWRLLVDGEKGETVLANGPFVAAWIPAGSHRLDFVYRPPGLFLGLTLAALALVGAVAWLVPQPSCQTATSSRSLRRMSGTSASGAG